MTYVLGLTGSIGMGKTTTAAMFRDAGIAVWDADATVHRLYDVGGAAVGPIRARFPQVIAEGRVARDALRDAIAQESSVLDAVQGIVHPLVAQDRQGFLDDHAGEIVVLDIPLLFETGGDASCDAVVVVTAPADVQRARVMARGQMSEVDFQLILSRQMPDAEKRARADYLVETLTLDAARAAVRDIIAKVRDAHARDRS